MDTIEQALRALHASDVKTVELYINDAHTKMQALQAAKDTLIGHLRQTAAGHARLVDALGSDLDIAPEGSET